MKKPSNKTDELLAKLGASLKESPLVSHARQQNGAQENVRENPAATAAAVARKEGRAGDGNRSWTQAPEKEPVAVSVNQRRVLAQEAKKTEGANVGAVNAQASTVHAQKAGGANAGSTQTAGAAKQTLASEEQRLKNVAQTMVMAAERAVRPGAMAIFSNEQPAGSAPNQNAALGAAMPMPPQPGLAANKAPEGMRMDALGVAEGFLDTMEKTGAPLDKEQVKELLQGREEGTLAPTMEETLKKMEMPLTEKQVAQMKEIQTLRQVLAEIRELQKQTPARANTSPSETPAMPMAAVGSQRHAVSGWRTSTVGLYPEDYEKAYAVMQYLTQQTGQPVNLSRVVKIALRALEIGPKVLEMNAQVKAKDRRVMRG